VNHTLYGVSVQRKNPLDLQCETECPRSSTAAFGDQKLFAFLAKLGFGYVIRFRGNIHVTDAEGTTRPAAEWVGRGGRARKLTDARVTAKGQ
jgi:hypothetical protein